ncbi:MAG: hypothetical protein ABI691_07690 [Ginsengibacter sp.]
MRIIILSIFSFFFSLHVMSQVAVSKEPRHHPVFENDKVRILNVLVPAGDTTQYHVHSTPSVFIMFTKTLTGSQRVNEPPQYSTSVPGTLWYEDLSEPHIKIHRVWNLDTSVFHVMDIELLSKEASFIINLQPIAHAHLQIDTPWAAVYKVHISNNENLSIRDIPSDFVLVAINEAEIKAVENNKETTSFIKPGQYYWINANDKFSLVNLGSGSADFALISIR